jgi:hypothetical protein
MIAVCMLTCGRADLTLKTANSFRKINAGRSDVLLWHVDAGPADRKQERNCAIAKFFDFDTLRAPAVREGQIDSFRVFMTAIAGSPVDFMLWLENDWESTHTIPTLEQLRGFAEVDQWRLYGHRKNAAGGPRSRAGTKNLGDGSALEWRPSQSIKGWEFTPRAHWGAGGTIVRPEKLQPFSGSIG